MQARRLSDTPVLDAAAITDVLDDVDSKEAVIAFLLNLYTAKVSRRQIEAVMGILLQASSWREAIVQDLTICERFPAEFVELFPVEERTLVGAVAKGKPAAQPTTDHERAAVVPPEEVRGEPQTAAPQLALSLVDAASDTIAHSVQPHATEEKRVSASELVERGEAHDSAPSSPVAEEVPVIACTTDSTESTQISSLAFAESDTASVEPISDATTEMRTSKGVEPTCRESPQTEPLNVASDPVSSRDGLEGPPLVAGAKAGDTPSTAQVPTTMDDEVAEDMAACYASAVEPQISSDSAEHKPDAPGSTQDEPRPAAKVAEPPNAAEHAVAGGTAEGNPEGSTHAAQPADMAAPPAPFAEPAPNPDQQACDHAAETFANGEAMKSVEEAVGDGNGFERGVSGAESDAPAACNPTKSTPMSGAHSIVVKDEESCCVIV